jgi:hypothetical protein
MLVHLKIKDRKNLTWGNLNQDTYRKSENNILAIFISEKILKSRCMQEDISTWWSNEDIIILPRLVLIVWIVFIW